MRCLVFAYQDIGYVCLRELLRAGAEVCAVVTHDDDPGEEIWFRSVRKLAEEHGLPVFAPDDVNQPEWVERLRAYAPDFLFSFYYRKMLAADLLALPRLGALNLHGSLLPKYRGRAPVNWAILHGETETGVTLHYMELKPDRGDIVAQRAVAIDAADTAHDVFGKLTQAAEELLRDVLPALRQGTAPRRPQDHAQASYFGGRRPADGILRWEQPAQRLYDLVRAVTHPYPGAFTHWRGRKLLVWQAARTSVDAIPNRPGFGTAQPGTIVATQPGLYVQCGDALLEMRRVQLEGQAEMPGPLWAEVNAVHEGERLA